MIKLDSHTILNILDATLYGSPFEFEGISIDTRTLVAGNLFVAVKGEQFDGHTFVDSIAKKAAGIIVAHKLDVSCPQLVVKDPTLALGQLAKYWAQQFHIPKVGITGSCGKTTTKQMLASILSKQGKVLYTHGNQNNQFGVPLTLFKLDPSYQFAVIEMGAACPGDIAYLTDIVQPQVGIVTNVVPVHVDDHNTQRFSNINEIWQEKTELFMHLPEQGFAVVNADSEFYYQWITKFKHKKTPWLSFGYADYADVKATELIRNAAMQYSFNLHIQQQQTKVQLSSLGRHNVENALAAAAAAHVLKIELKHIVAGLANVETITRRMQSYRGINDSLVIDDSYNANVKSVTAILHMLAEHQGKKIMVLGDMREIGEQSMAIHYQVGRLAKQLGICKLYAYGEQARYSVDAFGSNGFYFAQQQPLIAQITQDIDIDNTTMIAIKGSFALGMDKIVQALITE